MLNELGIQKRPGTLIPSYFIYIIRRNGFEKLTFKAERKVPGVAKTPIRCTDVIFREVGASFGERMRMTAYKVKWKQQTNQIS